VRHFADRRAENPATARQTPAGINRVFLRLSEFEPALVSLARIHAISDCGLAMMPWHKALTSGSRIGASSHIRIAPA
jgi:hypothetical protein